MRFAERRLTRRASLLITSSPAFIREYFDARNQASVPVELVENKHLEAALRVSRDGTTEMPAGPPWRVGWFGALRCNRSLKLLAEFSRREGGRVEVVLRGRPALSEFGDFHGLVEAEPYVSFGGAYRNPEDVGSLYGNVHFSWVIDFFEDGLNSKWLLPNRLYEGCRFGAVPIAMEGTETARFLRERNIGIVLPEPSADALHRALDGMDARRFRSLQASVRAQDRKTWACDRDDCRKLVERLRGLSASPRQHFSEALA
jgi:succinoglycan biosynthesis protein ExoL